MKSSFIAHDFLEYLAFGSKAKYSRVQDVIREKYNIEITTNKVKKAKQKSQLLLHGNRYDQYTKLQTYPEELRRTAQ